MGLLTTIHLLRENVLLRPIHLSISFFDKTSSASSLLSSSLPASFKLFNYIVFTIPYCLAFGYPYNYQISSHVKSLLLVFLPILLNIHLVAQSWHWYIKQLRIEWSQMPRGLILLFIRTPELGRLFPVLKICLEETYIITLFCSMGPVY